MEANDILGLVIALAILLAGAIVFRLTWSRLVIRRRAPGLLGRWLAESTATPLLLLVLAIGANVVFGRLARVRPLQELPATPYLSVILYIFTVLSVTWVGYGLVKGLCEWYLTRVAPRTGSKLDVELIPAFRRVAQVTLIFIALAVILGHYDVKLTALLGVAGVASLAGALAAQDTLANMISGFTIMIDRPFRIGDRIEISSGRLGDVIEIGLRSTRILSPDNTVHIVPNAELAKSMIINHSYPTDRINVRQRLSVAIGNDLHRVKQILLETCRAHPQILAEPPPMALVAEVLDASVVIAFNFWIEDFRARGQVLDEVYTRACERFEQEGVRTVGPMLDAVLRVGAGERVRV